MFEVIVILPCLHMISYPHSPSFFLYVYQWPTSGQFLFCCSSLLPVAAFSWFFPFVSFCPSQHHEVLGIRMQFFFANPIFVFHVPSAALEVARPCPVSKNNTLSHICWLRLFGSQKMKLNIRYIKLTPGPPCCIWRVAFPFPPGWDASTMQDYPHHLSSRQYHLYN